MTISLDLLLQLTSVRLKTLGECHRRALALCSHPQLDSAPRDVTKRDQKLANSTIFSRREWDLWQASEQRLETQIGLSVVG